MTQVLLITSDAATGSAVTAVLAELDGFTEPLVLSSAAQTRLELERQDIDMVLVDEALDGGEGLTVLREIAVLEPLMPVCLLTPRNDTDSIMRVLDAGGRAVLPLPPSVPQYAERLRSLSAWSRAAHGHVDAERASLNRPVGRIIAVIGSKGGVGTSIIALCAARAAAAHGPTALVDLDLRAGDMASYCGIRVRHSVVDLVSVAAELGSRELSEVVYPVKGGIDLLPAPEHGEMAETMTETASRQIVQAMRYQYTNVIIDCGSHMDDATAAALDLADEIVVVATPEVPALRAVRRLKESMSRLGLARSTPLHVLLNRTSRHNEIQPANASKLVGSPLLATLPDVGQKLEPALNTSSLLEMGLPAFKTAGAAVADLLGPVPAGAPAGTAPAAATAGPAAPMTLAPAPPSDGVATSGYGHVSSPPPPGAPAPAPGPSPMTANSPGAVGQGHVQGQAGGRRLRRQAEDQHRSGVFGGRLRRSRERGGTTVEFAGAFVIATGLFVLVVELLLFAAAHLLAHNAAQEAARSLGAGESRPQVLADIRVGMPGALTMTVGSNEDSENDDDEVRVRVSVPGLLPALGPAEATARIDGEK